MGVSNFTRVIWKLGHQGYEKDLARAASVYSKAEYEMVKQGLRLAATYHVDSEKIKEEYERFEKDDLIFTPLRKSAYYSGFSHCHVTPESGQPFYYYGALTRTKTVGKEFLNADTTGNHLIIGELLGFPGCCTEAFTKDFAVDYDPIWLTRQGEVPGFPECNQLLRYFGIRATSHFSCTPLCNQTKNVASLWLDVMKSLDESAAKLLYTFLGSPITWDSYHGVVEVDTPHFLGVTHTSTHLTKRVISFKPVV